MQQHVLMIDDDDDDRNMFAEALRSIHLQTECSAYASASEGLARLGEPPTPNWIFLDINMPRMGGFDCLVKLRSFRHLEGIPVVMYSTSKDASDIAKARQLGASFYLVKPNSFSVLCEQLQFLLGQKDRGNADFLVSLN